MGTAISTTCCARFAVPAQLRVASLIRKVKISQKPGESPVFDVILCYARRISEMSYSLSKSITKLLETSAVNLAGSSVLEANMP